MSGEQSRGCLERCREASALHEDLRRGSDCRRVQPSAEVANGTLRTREASPDGLDEDLTELSWNVVVVFQRVGNS